MSKQDRPAPVQAPRIGLGAVQKKNTVNLQRRCFYERILNRPTPCERPYDEDMKMKPKTPASTDIQPKTRRRARLADKRRKERGAGHDAGAAFFMSLYASDRGSDVARRLKIENSTTRAEIRKIIARGRQIEAPFAGDDEKRGEFTAPGRGRRMRAILAQHARRFGLHEIGARKFKR